MRNKKQLIFIVGQLAANKLLKRDNQPLVLLTVGRPLAKR